MVRYHIYQIDFFFPIITFYSFYPISSQIKLEKCSQPPLSCSIYIIMLSFDFTEPLTNLHKLFVDLQLTFDEPWWTFNQPSWIMRPQIHLKMNDLEVMHLLASFVIWLFFEKFQVRYCNMLLLSHLQSPSLLLEVWKRSHHHHVHKISPLKLKSSSGHKCTDFRHWWVVLDCKRAKKFHKKQEDRRTNEETEWRYEKEGVNVR